MSASSPAEAQAKVLRRFARPVTFTYHGKRWQVRPSQLGATADVSGAIDRALTGIGAAAKAVPVTISVDQTRVASYVSYLDGLFSREARTGSVRRVGRRAEVTEPQTALAVQTRRMQRIITHTLVSPVRSPVEVLVTEMKPTGPGSSSSSYASASSP